ncbi:hypothetical protein ACP4OV_006982 [Aristida adscensionis]
METCEKNKANRAKVKFYQTTGSRSSIVHCENLGDEYNNEDPDALDLFKACHYSKKKKCCTPAVQSAILKWNKISKPTEDEQHPKSVTEVVAEVLAENTKKNNFLQNVGIHMQPRSNVRGPQAELAAEKRANAELQMLVDSQQGEIGVLSNKLQETEEARIRDKEEMRKLTFCSKRCEQVRLLGKVVHETLLMELWSFAYC